MRVTIVRNIETFPSKQMCPYLSLDERKVAEFYHNIDRRRWLVWLKWLIFINFSGQLMVSLLIGSDRPTDGQCHLLSCPGQLKRSTTALQCSGSALKTLKSKVISMSEWVSEWQGHLLSCPGQLKTPCNYSSKVSHWEFEKWTLNEQDPASTMQKNG